MGEEGGKGGRGKDEERERGRNVRDGGGERGEVERVC